MPKMWGKTTAFFKCTVLLVQNKANNLEKFLEEITLIQMGWSQVAFFFSLFLLFSA